MYRALLERRQCIDFSQIPSSNGSASPASRGAAAAVEAAAIQALVPEMGRLRSLLQRDDLSPSQVSHLGACQARRVDNRNREQ